jgi:hypothetical protein
MSKSAYTPIIKKHSKGKRIKRRTEHLHQIFINTTGMPNDKADMQLQHTIN